MGARAREGGRGGAMFPFSLMALSLTVSLCLPAGCAAARAPAPIRPWTIPSDARIHALLVDMVDQRHVAPGMVIGIIGPQGRRGTAYGRRDANDPRPVDGETLSRWARSPSFSPGCCLPTWSSGARLGWTPPSPTCPPGMTLPELGGRRITLMDLATHTSGLPDFPRTWRQGTR